MRKIIRAGLFAAIMAGAAPACAQADPPPILHYEARNPRAPAGDRLTEARQIAAAVAAQLQAEPRQIADVGSFTGEFLEAFLDRFPAAHGQWTEPVDNNRVVAERRLGRFGTRASYVIGCPSRDIALGCTPPGMDMLLSSWLTIHLDLAGIERFHRHAFAMLPPGGTVTIIDHAGGDVAALTAAREAAIALDLAAAAEGPPVHHPEYVVPDQQQQLAAMRAAGFADVQVIWQRLDTFVMIGRKPGGDRAQ